MGMHKREFAFAERGTEQYAYPCLREYSIPAEDDATAARINLTERNSVAQRNDLTTLNINTVVSGIKKDMKYQAILTRLWTV